MTPREALEALKTFREEVGLTAFTDLTINPDHVRAGEAVCGILYPHGLAATDAPRIRVVAETLEGCVDKLRAAWIDQKAIHEAETIRKMALAIIRITDQFGSCTESALRNEFETNAVVQFMDGACAKADEMAGRGPFKVVRIARSNAA